MNKLILIGNGFDLAHGLKTSYNDFILWYMKTCFLSASTGQYEDTLIEIKINEPWIQAHLIGNVNAINTLVDQYYHRNFAQILPPPFTVGWNDKSNKEPFIINIKSDLLKTLLSNCSCTTWVEIETEFYELLKEILNKEAIYPTKQLELAELNTSLAFIIDKLKQYLSQLPNPTYDERYLSIFEPRLWKFDVLLPWSEGPQWRSEERYKVYRTCVLNFNYTQTAQLYLHHPNYDNPFETINIHGQLNDERDPLIFGFGDELDRDYLKMERERAKGYFKFIKSFWYFRTSNYWNLIRFIDSNEYQVSVLGHNCGLSDRTMLHMIFEHENCKSIKIFYHGDKDVNNYNETTYEIARHFSDKTLMRKRIVPFEQCKRIPQFDDDKNLEIF